MADTERRLGTLEDHMAHVFTTLDVLATNQNRLDEALATLADAQIRTQEQFLETDKRFAETDKHFAETDKRFAETDKRFAETDKRFAETDKRISDMASAIGALISEMRERRN